VSAAALESESDLLSSPHLTVGQVEHPIASRRTSGQHPLQFRCQLRFLSFSFSLRRAVCQFRSFPVSQSCHFAISHFPSLAVWQFGSLVLRLRACQGSCDAQPFRYKRYKDVAWPKRKQTNRNETRGAERRGVEWKARAERGRQGFCAVLPRTRRSAHFIYFISLLHTHHEEQTKKKAYTHTHTLERGGRQRQVLWMKFRAGTKRSNNVKKGGGGRTPLVLSALAPDPIPRASHAASGCTESPPPPTTHHAPKNKGKHKQCRQKTQSSFAKSPFRRDQTVRINKT